MKEKKILFFVNVLYAGAGKILLFVSDICAKAGWKVTVATLYDDNFLDYKKEGIDFINCDIKTDCSLWRIKALNRIREVVKASKPTITCCFVSDVVFMVKLATMGIKTIFVAAERGDPYTLPSKWIRPIKWAYGQSDFIVFQLNGARDFFSKKIKSKSIVIPNPYSSADLIEPYYGVRRKTIVSVGRLVEQKGYDILLMAFSLFQAKHPDYKLIIYGDGPLKEKLIEDAKRLGIREHVEFPGFIHNVSETIREDSVFVLSSRFEGIPNSLIEAMSIGVPTISTDCTPGGPRFLTDNGRRGILVDVDDYQKLADAISTIVDNKEIAEHYGMMGLEIIQTLNPNIIGQKWTDLFDKLLLM